MRKLRRSEADGKIITGQVDQLKSEYKKQEITKKNLQEELQQSENLKHDHEMQIQKLSLELEQVILSSQTHQADDKQIELLQNEIDKRCDELTAMKLTFQQESIRSKNEAQETIESLGAKNESDKIEFETQLRNMEIEYENGYEIYKK